jgi:hypothetical protein
LVQNWDRVNIVPRVQAQGTTKTVIINQLWGNDPIEVVKVMAEGKAGVVGVPARDDLRWFPDGGYFSGNQKEWRVAYRLQSDDNWLGSLSFVLRNRTSKKIDFVAIDVDLPQAATWATGFFFGQLPAVAAYDGATGEPLRPSTRLSISFTPGQQMTFALADSQHGVGHLIDKAQPLSQTSVIYVHFTVYMEDGTSWLERQWFKPDPEHRGETVLLKGHYFPGPLTGPPAPCQAEGRRGCM